MKKQIPLFFWTISYLKNYRLLLALLVLSCISYVTCQMVILKTMQYIVDNYDSGKLGVFVTINLFLLIFMIISLGCKNLLERVLRERAGRDLLTECTIHLRKLGYSYSEQHPSGDTLTLINNDISAVQEIYRNYFPSILTNFSIFILTVILTLSVNVELTLLALFCYSLYYLVGPIIDKKINKWGEIHSNNILQYNSKLYEGLKGLIELRTFNREEWDLKRILEKKEKWNISSIKTATYSNLRVVFRSGTLFLGIGIIFYRVPSLFIEGNITVGEFAVFMLFFFYLTNAVSNIINSIVGQRLVLYQAERIKRFLDIVPKIQNNIPHNAGFQIVGNVDFCKVNFHYSDSRPVLSEFDLKVKSGEKVAIVGSSGSGKSTILKLLARFYDPTEGEILIDGVPLRQLALSQIREYIGYLSQDSYLFNVTVRENITFGDPNITDDEIIKASKYSNAHDFIMKLPQGYDTVIYNNGVNLSGGQKQRITFARMLVKNSKIILLDEATSALDNENEWKIQTAINTVFAGKTIIAVVHRLSSLRNYDRIIVFHGGIVAESGTYEELLKQKGLFCKMLEDDASKRLEE